MRESFCLSGWARSNGIPAGEREGIGETSFRLFAEIHYLDGSTDGALVRYDYKAGNGRLKSVTYANGDTMKATYNAIGQMIAEKWYDSTENLTAHYKYTYDTQGNPLSYLGHTLTWEKGRYTGSFGQTNMQKKELDLSVGIKLFEALLGVPISRI